MEDDVEDKVEEPAVTKTSSSTRRIRASLAVSAAALFMKTVLLYLEIRKSSEYAIIICRRRLVCTLG